MKYKEGTLASEDAKRGYDSLIAPWETRQKGDTFTETESGRDDGSVMSAIDDKPVDLPPGLFAAMLDGDSEEGDESAHHSLTVNSEDDGRWGAYVGGRFYPISDILTEMGIDERGVWSLTSLYKSTGFLLTEFGNSSSTIPTSSMRWREEGWERR